MSVMCRFALYLGAEIPVGLLVTEPKNSIIHQSFHSHERSEPLNGDGFGIGWYAEGREEPALFKEVTPAWNNQNLLHLAPVTRTRCLLAHVRAASPGLPVQQLNCHPFACGPYAFMHNGSIGGFHGIRRAILAELSDAAFSAVQGNTDSEHLFGLFLDRVHEAPAGQSSLERMDAALCGAIERVEALREASGATDHSLLNLVVTDGRSAVVTRYVSPGCDKANSLYVHAGRRYECEGGVCRMSEPDSEGDHAVIAASEPLSEDPGWERVPVNHRVRIHPSLHTEILPC